MNKHLKMITDYMSKYNLTQREMAVKLSITDATLSRWLNGVIELNVKNQAYIEFVCNELTHVPKKDIQTTDVLLGMLLDEWEKLSRSEKLKLLDYIETLKAKEAAPVTQPGEPVTIKHRPGFHGTQNKLRGIPLMILQSAIGE